MTTTNQTAAPVAPVSADDPEIKARYEVHKARRIKQGKQPFSFADWLDCYLSGKSGGLLSDNDKSIAGKNSAKARRQRRKLQSSNNTTKTTTT